MKLFVSVFFLTMLFSFTGINSAKAQLMANAGPNVTVCPGDSIQIGGSLSSPSASGGHPPYTYAWQPSNGVTNATIANPSAFPVAATTYTLIVTDSIGTMDTSEVTVSLSYINNVYAGANVSICKFQTTQIGSDFNVTGQGVSYSWSPSTLLYDNDSTLPRPIATPLQTTTYTLTATMAGCQPKTSTVTVTVIYVNIDAGLDDTINEGQNVVLHATGAVEYYWSSPGTSVNTLTYPNTADPDAEPIVTTTYVVWGTDPTHQCTNYDSVQVYVIPGDNVYFYNTFTPNGDGNNDTWYIGNIYKYPDNNLTVFNRYGQVVFKAQNYQNTWDGKSFGQDLPAATYFYIMDLGNGAPTYHGSVTIIK